MYKNSVLLSCKISSSVLSFLENQGEDISPLLEATQLPEEFLRDPSYWMQAQDMEVFLFQALEISMRHFEGPLFQKIGHEGPSLRSWGVFDSVLRMMPKPHEILSQPGRFLAYFISPAPPIDNVQRTEHSIEFDLPISTDQYPLSAAYLAASFESLPLYVGQALASCEWQGIHVKLRWNTDQENFFDGVDLGHTLSPDLMRNVMATLEKHAKDLEEKNRELQAKNEALQLAQKELEASLNAKLMLSSQQSPTLLSLTEEAWAHGNQRSDLCSAESLEQMQQDFSRLGDYMVRAQQLVTMLVAQGRLTPQVKEAMRRVDWDRVQKQFPMTLEDCRRRLEFSKTEVNLQSYQQRQQNSGEEPHV
jgi:hypothetical protein